MCFVSIAFSLRQHKRDGYVDGKVQLEGIKVVHGRLLFRIPKSPKSPQIQFRVRFTRVVHTPTFPSQLSNFLCLSFSTFTPPSFFI